MPVAICTFLAFFLLTAFVVTGNAPLDWPPNTTVSAGTVTTVGLLLNKVTTAPSVAEPNLTVPVDGLPPATIAGLNETVDRTGRGGGVTTPPLAPAVEVDITLQHTSRRAAERADRGKEPRRMSNDASMRRKMSPETQSKRNATRNSSATSQRLAGVARRGHAIRQLLRHAGCRGARETLTA